MQNHTKYFVRHGITFRYCCTSVHSLMCACQLYSVESVFKFKSTLSLHHICVLYGTVCFQLTRFSFDDCVTRNVSIKLVIFVYIIMSREYILTIKNLPTADSVDHPYNPATSNSRHCKMTEPGPTHAHLHIARLFMNFTLNQPSLAMDEIFAGVQSETGMRKCRSTLFVASVINRDQENQRWV